MGTLRIVSSAAIKLLSSGTSSRAKASKAATGARFCHRWASTTLMGIRQATSARWVGNNRGKSSISSVLFQNLVSRAQVKVCSSTKLPLPSQRAQVCWPLPPQAPHLAVKTSVGAGSGRASAWGCGWSTTPVPLQTLQTTWRSPLHWGQGKMRVEEGKVISWGATSVKAGRRGTLISQSPGKGPVAGRSSLRWGRRRGCGGVRVS